MVILSFHMLTTVYHILWQNEPRPVLVTIGYVFHSTDVSASCSQDRVYSHVRNSSIVHKQDNIVWTQVENDINTGVLIIRMCLFNSVLVVHICIFNLQITYCNNHKHVIYLQDIN